MNEKYIRYFINVCNETARLSTCASKAVGAILVRDKRILAIGYNGVPSGCQHCNKIHDPYKMMVGEIYRDMHHKWSQRNELHAEQNLIAFCAKNNVNTNNTTLFVSISPCKHCAKLILASGIGVVYYLKEYDKDSTGLDFLRINNVECIEVNLDGKGRPKVVCNKMQETGSTEE